MQAKFSWNKQICDRGEGGRSVETFVTKHFESRHRSSAFAIVGHSSVRRNPCISGHVLSPARETCSPTSSRRCQALPFGSARASCFTVHQSSRAVAGNTNIDLRIGIGTSPRIYRSSRRLRRRAVRGRGGTMTLKMSVASFADADTFVSRVSVSTVPLADVYVDSHSILDAVVGEIASATVRLIANHECYCAVANKIPSPSTRDSSVE